MVEYSIELSEPYISIRCPEGPSFGGSQEWFESKTIRDYGCGLIGAADVLLYMSRSWQPDCIGSAGPGRGNEEAEDGEKRPEALWQKEYEPEDYKRRVAALRKNFPILPGFGMPGWFLSLGFNCWFRKRKLSYRARWGVPYERLLESVAEMLAGNIPVILSAGPHFPRFWGKEGLTLYREEKENQMIPAAKTRAHYVIVTALCGEWIRISSWGRRYYIRISEYQDYVRRYSCPLFSNICLIRKR